VVGWQAALGEKFLDVTVGERNRRYHPTAQVITAGSKWRHLNKGGRDCRTLAAYQDADDEATAFQLFLSQPFYKSTSAANRWWTSVRVSV
jgi:hypothetical protein